MIEEPIRIEADPGTAEPLRQLLRSARGDGLEAAAVVRVAAGLGHATGGPGPAVAAASGARRAWGLGLGATAILALTIVASGDPPAPPEPAPTTTAALQPAQRDFEARETIDPPPLSPEVAEVAPAVDDSARAETEPSPRRSPARTGPATEEASIVPEAAMLLQARRWLRRDAGRTLMLTDTHRTKFPTSALAQERESLAILALVQLGRVTEATSRAERFFAKFPASPHEANIRRALAGADDEGSEEAPPGDTNPP